MHELHAVEALVKQAVAKANEHKASKVTKVVFSLGDLVGFDDGSIKLYFDDLAKGTLLESASLVINHKAPRLKCKDCSNVFEDKNRQFKCPKCCSASLIISSGKEFYLENIEIESE